VDSDIERWYEKVDEENVRFGSRNWNDQIYVLHSEDDVGRRDRMMTDEE